MVSTRKSRALGALLWATLAVYSFLVWWSPSFRHLMYAEQWGFGLLTGWFAHQGWQAHRNRTAAKREAAHGETIVRFHGTITDEQAAEIRERFVALYRKPGAQ